MIITVLQVRCFSIEKCLLKLNKAAYIRRMENSSQFCLVFIEEKMAYFSLNISLIRHGPSFDFCLCAKNSDSHKIHVHKHSTGVISDDE
ncbi:hypothetical protein T06_11626 [Trichinella sp. T6]|nr:hypothetical protein T06_11626 [Trichinella sp. T6]